MIGQPPTELPDLRRADEIGFDLETKDDGIGEGRGSSWPWHGGYVVGVSVAYRREGGEMRSDYFPIAHPDSENFDREQVFQWVRDHVAAGPKFVTFNGGYDFGWLRSEAGIRMPPPNRLEDASAAEALINENELEYNLDAVCKRYGLPGKDTTLLEEAVKAAGFRISRKTPLASYIWRLPAHLIGPYAAADAAQTLELHDKLSPIIDREGLRPAYRLEIELLQVLLEMRLRGIKVNQAAAEQAQARLFAKRDAALSRISELIGAPIGLKEIRNPDWKVATFNAREISYPRTELGNPSFEGGVDGWMTKHADELPRLISSAISYHNAADKFLGKFVIAHIVNGRIHAEINQFRREDGGARSSRFSYKSPALQQMPSKDEELAAEIRGVFEPEDGEWWFDADVSQQEFRILVDKGEQYGLSGAREMADVYRNDPDADVHAMVATMVELDRKLAKGCNFAKVYGMGVPAFATKIGKPVEEARRIMAKYDAKLPFAKGLSDTFQSIAERNGAITLLDGARRHFDLYEAARIKWTKDAGPCRIDEARWRVADPEHPWYRHELRRAGSYKALNAVIQGDAARQTKLWLRDVYYQTGIVPRLQMHDSLSFSVKSFEQAEVVARLGCDAIKLSVPIRIDMGFGRAWGEASRKDAANWAALTGDTAPGHDAKYVITSAGATATSRPPPQMPTRKPALVQDWMPPQPLAATATTPATSPAVAAAAGIRFTPPDAILAASLEEPPDAPAPPGKSNGHSNGHDTGQPLETSPTAIDVHKIGITTFKNISAQSMTYNLLTLRQIATNIATKTATSKEELPLLKLQRFGDQRTDKSCLRSDANVLEIFGAEGEHDKGTLSFAEATAALHKAGIRCLVYTSPSYVPGTKERWRVLAPTSGTLAPSLRAGLVARLNGILGGVLAPMESFTLSQSFYYGSIDNNPNHQVRLLDGDFIDLRDDLVAGAISKDGSKAGDPAPGSRAASQASGDRQPSEPWEDLVVKILSGDVLHPNLVVLSAKLVTAGMNPAAVENLLRGLMDKSATAKDARWKERYDDIPRIVASAETKYAPTPSIDISMLAAHLKGLGGPAPGAGTGSSSNTNAGAAPGGAGSGNASGGSTGPAPATPPLIDARPFVLRDPKALTKRDWIYGTQLIRKFGSATFAPSGSGKSNLMIVEALAIATGRPLLGILPPKRARVWYWNGEDPYDELERRVGAACLHYGIDAAELDGWLFINSGRDQGSTVVIGKQEKNGTTIAIPVVQALIATIYTNKIDVVMIDPFISSHMVPENDNNAIDLVAKTWTMIADVTNTAIDLAHHTRKTGGAAVTVEDGRGASALLGAVRPARVLNVMTEDEALKGGIVDGRRRYFKVEDGKNNLALPPDKLEWYRSESIYLGNGDPNDPNDMGDDMGVVTTWEWPNAMAGISDEDVEKVKEAIRAGKWRKYITAKDWVGHAVAKALGLGDVREKGVARARVTTMVNTWIYSGVLKVVVEKDANSDDREFVEVA